MTTDLDLAALFGATVDRTIDGAARRADSVAELVFSTGARYGFDRAVVVGRRCETSAESLNVHHVEVEHPMLSRRHACLSPVGRRASVIDLGSTNGTVVVAPDGTVTACLAGHLVLIEVGWRVEFAGAVAATVEPDEATRADGDGDDDSSLAA